MACTSRAQAPSPRAPTGHLPLPPRLPFPPPLPSLPRPPQTHAHRAHARRARAHIFPSPHAACSRPSGGPRRPTRLAARATLGCCHLCAHHCGADRRAGPAGRCHAGPSARVFSAQTEVADELAHGPTFAIAFGGCDLRCDFRITGRESWDAGAGEPFDPAPLAARATAALAAGARTVMILGGEPTIHLPDALALAALLPDSARLAWKTNAHASAEARALLDGVFGLWVADYKFGNDACAARLARAPAYTAPVRETLLWAARDHELIVRHLLMPGHIECAGAPSPPGSPLILPPRQSASAPASGPPGAPASTPNYNPPPPPPNSPSPSRP